MGNAFNSDTNLTDKTMQAAKELVENFLRVIMIPDPDGARTFTSPDLRIRFTGGREMRNPSECSAFNSSRYAWVKKRIERNDVVAGATTEEAIVYSVGTLYGAWPDGALFEGNRYVDRYVVSRGFITQMEVWNDSAEWLLVRAGLAQGWLSPMATSTSVNTP